MKRGVSTPTIVTLTPLEVQSDSRTYKQAASCARLGYRSIVVEGYRSSLDPRALPFELISAAPARAPASPDVKRSAPPSVGVFRRALVTTRRGTIALRSQA